LEKSDAELGWAAGILDGEGCIGLWPDSRRPYSARMSVYIANTDERMLLEFQRLFGGTVTPRKTAAMGAGFKRVPIIKPQWVWQAHGASAIPVLEAVLPYLICKKEKAELCLAWGKTITHSPGKRIQWPRLSEEHKMRRVQILEAI
jgi:hypothetical protein